MLKSCLQLLLSKFYSKKDSALVGHQSMPQSLRIDIPIEQNEQKVFVAPADGRIYAAWQLNIGGRLFITTPNALEVSIPTADPNNVVSGGIAVTKGTSVIIASPIELTKNYWTTFIPNIGELGGGINLLTSLFIKEGCYA